MEIRAVISELLNGTDDDTLLRMGATPEQLAFAHNPPPERDVATDRYMITVQGVHHTTFKCTRSRLDLAMQKADQVAGWSRFRTKRVIVTDRIPVEREVDSIFGGKRTSQRTRVVYYGNASKAQRSA